VEAVCPFLALAADRRTVIEGVDPAHRCHAEDPPGTIERGYQARVCLTAAYPQCERYLAFSDGPGSRDPARAGIGDGLVSTRLTLTPEPTWHGLAGRARVGRRGGMAVIAASGALLAIGAAATVTNGFGLLGEPTAPLAGASPSATERPTPTERPQATPTAIPTAAATPMPTPTTAPTVAPTPAPTAVPVRTYVVEQGDTLAAIAQQFGSSIEAIQAANDIEDPNEITIGQVLVIP
jgi:nucleoid-associated protein YgaU